MTNFFRTKLFKILIIASISIFLVFLNPYNFFAPIRSAFFFVFSPFQKVAYGLAFEASEIKNFVCSIGQLKKENEKLIEEKRTLLAQIAKLREMEKENEKLREELNILPMDKFDLEGAVVIGQDSREQKSWLEIDKGRSDGISEGMPVIVNSGILVGKIGEVFPTTSKIILISDIQSSVNAVDSETESRGIIKGEFGLGIILDMVLQSEALNQGDKVVTSGVGKGFPSGLLIGSVGEIGSAGDGIFQRAIVSSPVDFSRLQFVFVIKN